jgi:hypothetical protein
MSDTKKRILARRAQLVVAALSAVACEPQARPVPCLETLVIPPADASTEDATTASVVFESPADAGASDPPDAGPPIRPTVCLSPVPNPKPRPCLKPVAPHVCLYMK